MDELNFLLQVSNINTDYTTVLHDDVQALRKTYTDMKNGSDFCLVLQPNACIDYLDETKLTIFIRYHIFDIVKQTLNDPVDEMLLQSIIDYYIELTCPDT